MAAADSRSGGARGRAFAVVATAAVLPRLAVLLYERADITRAYVDKGDDFAQTFLEHGTYGFIPGRPSAYTQPLYGFFLTAIYWISDRSWITVGLAQIAVAALTALLVFVTAFAVGLGPGLLVDDLRHLAGAGSQEEIQRELVFRERTGR